MKVLSFSSLYPNNVWSHHGVFVKERLGAIARLGEHELRVIAPVPYYPPFLPGKLRSYSRVARQERIDGIDVYHPRYFFIPKVGMRLHGRLMFRSLLPAVKKLQKEFPFDLIDAHYVYPDGYAAVLLGAYFGKPVLVTARGSDIHLFPSFPGVGERIQYTLRHSARVIAVSQGLTDAIVRLGFDAERVLTIPNGVDTSKFFPGDSAESRRKLGLSEKRVILSVGNLKPVKGFDLLLRAFERLLHTRAQRDVILAIGGDGECRGALERQIAAAGLQKDVILAGDVAHEDLRDWYNAADVFCLASQREGCPNVVLESLACGTPVVGADAQGISELLGPAEFGRVAPRNEAALAASLEAALSENFSREAVAKSMSGRSWNDVAMQLEQVFSEVITENLRAKVERRLS